MEVEVDQGRQVYHVSRKELLCVCLCVEGPGGGCAAENMADRLEFSVRCEQAQR